MFMYDLLLSVLLYRANSQVPGTRKTTSHMNQTVATTKTKTTIETETEAATKTITLQRHRQELITTTRATATNKTNLKGFLFNFYSNLLHNYVCSNLLTTLAGTLITEQQQTRCNNKVNFFRSNLTTLHPKKISYSL